MSVQLDYQSSHGQGLPGDNECFDFFDLEAFVDMLY